MAPKQIFGAGWGGREGRRTRPSEPYASWACGGGNQALYTTWNCSPENESIAQLAECHFLPREHTAPSLPQMLKTLVNRHCKILMQNPLLRGAIWAHSPDSGDS